MASMRAYQYVSHLDIGANLRRLWSQALADIANQFILDHVALKCNLIPHVGVRDAQFEGIHSMSVLLVQRPPNILVQLLDGCVGLLRHMTHDRVHHLALVVPFLTLDNILGRNSSLRQIDVALFLVDTQHHHNFVAPDSDKLLDRSDTSSREFGEQNHAVDVVVFEEFDVGAHFCDLLDVDHDERVDFGIFLLVEAAIGERHGCSVVGSQSFSA